MEQHHQELDMDMDTNTNIEKDKFKPYRYGTYHHHGVDVVEERGVMGNVWWQPRQRQQTKKKVLVT